MTVLLKKINQLKLFGMHESLNYRLTEASQSNLSHQEFLQIMLEDESLYRDNRRFATLRKRAHFKDKVTLEEFELDGKRGINKTMIQKMQSLGFLKSTENLIIIGGTGAGKTFLAQAIGHVACHDGHEVLFLPVNMLFNQIMAAEKSGTIVSFLKRLNRPELLIFDDFGLRNYSHHEATMLYQILENRYRKGSIVITTQVKTKGWMPLFEDQVIAESIVDRLVSSAHVIEVKGPSYRSKFSPKKQISVDA